MSTQPESDATIDEIRKVRHRISADCSHDPVQLIQRYLRLQAQYADQLIDPSDSTKAVPPTAA